MRDWLKTLERGLDKVTTEALRVTDGARKVAGIGVGTLAFDLGRAHFAPGDAVTGILRLQLSEPTEAAGVSVTLRATRKRVSLGSGSRGRQVSPPRTETLHSFTCNVAGAGTYQKEAFPFAVQIPKVLEPQVDVDGLIGDVFKVAQGIRSLTASQVAWVLEGAVDVPWKRNPREIIDLSVE